MEANKRPSLVGRLMRNFLSGVRGQVEDRLAEIIILLVSFTERVYPGNLTWAKVIGTWRQNIATAVFVISWVIVWHIFRASYAVIKEIQKEENERGPIQPRFSKVLSSSGEPIPIHSPEISAYSFPKLKLLGIAFGILGLAIVASKWAWNFSLPTPPKTTQQPATVTAVGTITVAPAPAHILILYNGEPLNGRVMRMVDFTNHLGFRYLITLRNSGSLNTGEISVRLSLSQLVDLSPGSKWEATETKESRYPLELRAYAPSLASHDRRLLPDLVGTVRRGIVPIDAEMDVFYGSDQPAKAKFQIAGPGGPKLP